MNDPGPQDDWGLPSTERLNRQREFDNYNREALELDHDIKIRKISRWAALVFVVTGCIGMLVRMILDPSIYNIGVFVFMIIVVIAAPTIPAAKAWRFITSFIRFGKH